MRCLVRDPPAACGNCRGYGAAVGDPPVPLIDVGGFDNVDSSATPEDYARWMAHQRVWGADRAIGRLELDSTSRVLDLGCGTGIDLQQMAELAGRCVGIDRSLAMVCASREIVGVRASLACGDGSALPFAMDSFDACWSRLVLLHTPRPAMVVAEVAEVARVVRAGGRAVFVEPDHGTHIVNTPEIEVFERVVHHRRTTFRDPLVGRRLPGLVSAAGMEVEQVRATPIVHTSLATARASGGPFDVAVEAAVAADAVTADEGRRYLSSLEQLDAAGAFVFSAMALSVVAVVDPAA